MPTLAAFCLVWFASSILAAAPPATAHPNIVFILADDLGWRDTGIYGSTFYQTPHIDRLARRGLRFVNAYAASPLCSPTRSSIMTGLYPGRIGITVPACHIEQVFLEAKLPPRARPTEKALTPITATRLKTTYPTLAEDLKAAGYVTGHFGKWHLGREPYSPLQHGFDVDVPHYSGPGPPGYIAPWHFGPDLQFVGQPGEHIEDRMAREAVAFIRNNKDRPFYLNYWAFSVHEPWQAKPELIEKYRRLADPHNVQHNPVYAAMVESLDDAVGRLIDTLDELKLTENTIIIFFSDNGGVHWLDDRLRKQKLTSPPTSNAPLRGGKATLYEGGTREPFIVNWPGHVRADSVSESLFSSIDFRPTLLEMAGVRKLEAKDCDGVSQVPTIIGQGPARDTVFCYFPHYVPATAALPGCWVRRGDWKLIRLFCDNADQTDRFELFNLKDDVSETRNVAADHPALVEELNKLIAAHIDTIAAPFPRPNPAYRPAASTAPATRGS